MAASVNTLTCKEINQQILPFINGELTDKEIGLFMEHVKNCPSCYEELEVNYTIYKGLEQLDEMEGEFNIDRLMENLLNRSEKRIILHKAFNASFVAIQLAALAVLAVMLISM